MKKYSQILLLSAFWLTACVSQTPLSTQLVEASSTSSPTKTSTPQPTKISTSTPTLTSDQAITATVQALASDCTLGSELSPDKKWVAIKCAEMKLNQDDESSTTLKIVNLDSFQEWLISYYQTYGVQEIESVRGMSDGMIFVEQWSTDTSYLYIGVMPNVYNEFEFNRIAALFRLDLRTGETTEILGPEEVQKTFYDYSISPNEKRIAFIRLLEKPLQVEIKDFDSDQIQSISLDLKFSTAGSIVWSKDNRHVIFMAVEFNKVAPYISTTIFQWDIQGNDLKEISHLIDRLFFIVKWDEENEILTLRDYFEEDYFELKISNGQLSPISP